MDVLRIVTTSSFGPWTSKIFNNAPSLIGSVSPHVKKNTLLVKESS